jgi:hypothetical protein
MKWVDKLVFKYYKFVQWLNIELEDEPVFLPCIVPIGLIGSDNIYGSGFHTTLLPKFKFEDLLIRLKWVLENYNNTPEFKEKLNNYPQEIYGPLIKPNFRSCNIIDTSDEELYKLLFTGIGSVKVSPNGKIHKFDVSVAKNYLSEYEMQQLQRLVSAYLDIAEDMAIRQIPMTMEDWESRLNKFIEAVDREILQNAGKVTAEIAKAHAESEFEKYRIIQDRLFESDFDKIIKNQFPTKKV